MRIMRDAPDSAGLSLTMPPSASTIVGSIFARTLNANAVAPYQRGTISSHTAECCGQTIATRGSFGSSSVSWQRIQLRLDSPTPLRAKGKFGGCLLEPWVWRKGCGGAVPRCGLRSPLDVVRPSLALRMTGGLSRLVGLAAGGGDRGRGLGRNAGYRWGSARMHYPVWIWEDNGRSH